MAEIGNGLVILLGVGPEDGERQVGYLVEKKTGVMNVELWMLMHVFGPLMRHAYATFEVPFEGVVLWVEGAGRPPPLALDRDDDEGEDEEGEQSHG